MLAAAILTLGAGCATTQPAREFAYGAESHIGTFSDALMAEAKERKWTIISMKDDWKRIFPFENK